MEITIIGSQVKLSKIFKKQMKNAFHLFFYMIKLFCNIGRKLVVIRDVVCMEKNKKQALILSIVGVLTLITLVACATYA